MTRGRRRRLGQHYLVKRGPVVSWFKRRLCGRRLVLELGAGHGELTSALTSCVLHHVSLEIDPSLLSHLLGLELSHGVGLTVVQGDALNPPLRLKAFEAIYGNLPYSISTELIALMVRDYQGPVYVMVQREVARRLAARPGSEEYGRLTALVSLVYEVKPGPVIPPSYFKPRPKVYSQLVEMLPVRRCDRSYVECFEKVTRCLFSQRRRLAYKAVVSCFDADVEVARRFLGVKRVYSLGVDELERIARLYGGCSGGCRTLYMPAR